MLGAITVLVLALAVSACEKSGGSESRQVRFSAVSRAESAVGTRTAYSGEYTEGSDNKVYERIDWLGSESNTPDRIKIGMVKSMDTQNQSFASSEYVISQVSTEGLKSVASIEPVSANGLQWGDNEGLYRFMGVYPSSGTIAYDGSVNPGVGTVSGMSIPSAVTIDLSSSSSNNNVSYPADLSNAWMLADVRNVQEDANVGLDFYPAFTAFEFTIKCQTSNPIYLNSFSLSSASTAINGSYTATLNTGGASTYSFPTATSNNEITTVTFSGTGANANGLEVTDTKSATFTILALPTALSDLSITVTAKRQGPNNTLVPFTRKLALKNSNIQSNDGFITFDACNKHRILGLAMPDGDFRLIFDFQVAEWELATDNPYQYVSPSAARIRSMDATYRRYDSDNDDYTDWDGSHIVVSYGYKNQLGEVVGLNDEAMATSPTGYEAYRAGFSPIIKLGSISDGSAAFRLVLDNPSFKFIKYNYDETTGEYLAYHQYSDAIDITESVTYFSVVPARQFANDATTIQKTCTVSLLSVAEGTLHVMPFNMSGTNYLESGDAYYRLPGESEKELKFYYVGPSDYATTGDLFDSDGTQHN